jgi:hypothetical protein
VEKQLPDVFISGGAPITTDGKDATAIFHEGTVALSDLLADLLETIKDRRVEDFHMLMQGRSSVSDRYTRSKGVVWKRSS